MAASFGFAAGSDCHMVLSQKIIAALPIMKSKLLLGLALVLSGGVACSTTAQPRVKAINHPLKLTTRSAGLDAATVESWGAQKNFFVSEYFEIVPWKNAKAALLGRKIVGGKQYHTGWVTLYGVDGEKLLTRLIGYNDIYTFFKEHDLKLEGFGTE